ncbi:MAG: phage tail assembly chaperone [Paracoccus sp. (in: a-proteobacteria)]
MSAKAAGGMDWPGLLRVGIGPARLGGLGLTPAEFWALTPAELALMLGIEPGKGAGMTRDRLAELVARYPDTPAK